MAAVRLACHRPVLAVALALAGAAAHAQAEYPGAGCEFEVSAERLITERSETISSFERMPEGCLKTLFSECSGWANRGLLDPHSAAICSVGYEALLRKSFGGSFQAMLAWWRAERTRPLR